MPDPCHKNRVEGLTPIIQMIIIIITSEKEAGRIQVRAARTGFRYARPGGSTAATFSVVANRVVIEHGEESHQLRRTRTGKLIPTQ